MKTDTACPQTEELRQLLDGSLSGERSRNARSIWTPASAARPSSKRSATEGTRFSQVVEAPA